MATTDARKTNYKAKLTDGFFFQVLNFVQTYAALLPDYEVACEHEHSNCVLIAHKKVRGFLLKLGTFFTKLWQFKINGKWWTWIDYPKFHELVTGDFF